MILRLRHLALVIVGALLWIAIWYAVGMILFLR